jgi:hypothetical protein
MRQNLPYRAWFYFRQGWATYFALIFAAINTLVVTYYLAIENLPILKQIFPTFAIYSAALIFIGIPLLILIGYAHYKKSPAFKTEAEISFESNPPLYRMLQNTELILPMCLQLSNMLVKLSKNEKLTAEETEELEKIQKKLAEHIGSQSFGKS